MAGIYTGCGCITNRTGALIIGWIEVVATVLLTLASLTVPVIVLSTTRSGGSTDSDAVTGGVVAWSICGLYLFIPCCLIYGVKNNRPSLLIPYIIMAILRITGILGFIIAFAFMSPPVVIPLVVWLTIELWKTVVVCCHYNYQSAAPPDGQEILLHKGAYDI